MRSLEDDSYILPPYGQPVVGANSSGFQTQTVYGLITAPQNVTPGAYSTASNITVTVTY
jgi:spore coat protein U-like protein